jgi:hypothetical protein
MKPYLVDFALSPFVQTFSDILNKKSLAHKFGEALRKISNNILKPKEILRTNPHGETTFLLDQKIPQYGQIAESIITLFEEIDIHGGDAASLVSLIREKLRHVLRYQRKKLGVHNPKPVSALE